VFVQPLLQWQSKNYFIFWERIFSIRDLEWDAHARCCHLWLARLYKICSTFFISGTIFLKKKVIEHKSASRFSLQLLSETFLILRRVERDIKSVYWSSCKVPISKNFLDIFSKNSQIWKFLKIRSVGAELFHAVRQKDRHDVAYSRF